MIDDRSVESRRRLLHHLPEALMLLVAVVIAWRLFVLPKLHHQAPAKATAASLATLEGGRFDPSRVPGRTVVLDFWASWCEPCKAALPLVERFAATHPEVRVVAVDEGEPIPVAAAFARAHGMHDVAFDPGHELEQPYGVQGYPTLVAIDPDGYVRDRWFGYFPNIGAVLADAARRYDAERREKKAAIPRSAS